VGGFNLKNVACIIVRTNSKRLSKKVLREINGIKLIEYIIKKIKRSKLVDEIYLCTSIDKDDEILIEIASKNNIKSFAGDRESVINRMLEVAKIENADNVVRITGDNIFTDEVYLDLMLKYHNKNNVDYTRTEYLPMGVTAEVIRTTALKRCYSLMDAKFSQYLLLYIFQPEKYNCQVLIPEDMHRHPDWSLTVDTPDDLRRTEEIIGKQNNIPNYIDILSICKNNKINHLYYKVSDNVKYPGGLMITYSAFRKEMEERIKKSKNIQLKKVEYLEALNGK
jgi:spore coat polysaccharide biosynthesis protein SpsF